MRALVIGAAMLCSVTNTGRSVCGDQEFALVLRHQVRIDARADELDRFLSLPRGGGSRGSPGAHLPMSDPRAGPQIVAPLLTPVAAPPRWSADPAGAGGTFRQRDAFGGPSVATLAAVTASSSAYSVRVQVSSQRSSCQRESCEH